MALLGYFRKVRWIAVAAAVSCVCAQTGTCWEQGANTAATKGEAAKPEGQTWRIKGIVRTPKGDPVPGAEVEIQASTTPPAHRTVVTNGKGEFAASFYFLQARKPPLEFRLTATKEGAQDARERVTGYSPAHVPSVEMVVASNQADPKQLDIETLNSELLPRFRLSGKNAGALGPEHEAYEAGERDLGDGAAGEAADRLRPVVSQLPTCVECRSLLALALLSDGGWTGARAQAADAARQIGPLDAKDRRAEPFVILGVLSTHQEQLRRAAFFFLQALEVNPKDPLALQELGRVMVLEHNMKAADEYLSRAIKAGAQSDAHWLRAQALLEMGQPAPAEEEMTAFLGDRKPKQLPDATRAMWAEMEAREDLETRGQTRSVVEEPVANLVAARPELRGLQPAPNQDQLPGILRKVGDNVQDFFRDFPSTSSVEEIRLERLHPDGKVADSLEQQYQYLALVPPDQSVMGLEEYRSDRRGQHVLAQGFEGRFMVTQGFVSAPLYFHPSYQRGAVFRDLGRESLNGHDAEVIAFAQRPETARILESFRVNAQSTNVLLQGIAWINLKDYQILRIRTDLLKPAEQIRLEQQTTDIDFGEVHFKGGTESLWLPRQVDVTVAWNGRIFRNEHRYSDFQLFQVEEHQRFKGLRPPPPHENEH